MQNKTIAMLMKGMVPLLLPLCLPASADLTAAQNALRNGECEVAARELLPLATSGSILAQAALGDFYRKGIGLAKELQEAVRWFRLGAEQGNPRAQDDLGCLYAEGQGVTQVFKAAAKWCLRASALVKKGRDHTTPSSSSPPRNGALPSWGQ